MTEKDVNKLFEDIRIYWEEEYPGKPLEERKQILYTMVHKTMRTQGEALGDEYSGFTKEWYEYMKTIEPKFDAYFEEIIAHLDRTYFITTKFNWELYRANISE